jgi:deoxyribose-phosphate aldolase
MVVHKNQNDNRLRDLYLANQLLTDDEVINYAKEAVKSELHAITVNTACVKNLGTILKNSKTKLRVAVGFPYGQQYSEIKYLEAKKSYCRWSR